MSKLTKFVAFCMASVMVAGSSLTAFAANAGEDGGEVEVTGAGTAEFVNMEQFAITVPTGDALTKTFAYSVDPQGLASIVDTAGKIETGATVLFANGSGGEMSSTSDALEVVNKSSMPLKVSVTVKMDATSKTYAGGFSTTSDFSKTADAAVGMYIGLQSSYELEMAVGTAGETYSNIIPTAKDAYKLTKSGSAFVYELDTAATGLPKFTFKVTGKVNPDAADSLFATVDSSGNVEKKTMPTISLKFTPSSVKTIKDGTVSKDDNAGTIWVGKADATDEDGGFGTTKPTAIEVNGKSVTTIAANEGGWATITWDNIVKAWGYTKAEDLTDEQAAELWKCVKSVKVTVNGVAYYVEIPDATNGG